MLITLVYGSKSSHPMSQENLLTLLEQSREYNKNNGITGVLLYKDCRFLQVLEGEQDSVEYLFDKIQNDNRNSGIIIYLKKEIDERDFGEWQMGFLNLELDTHIDLDGFTTFLDRYDEIDSQYVDNPSEVYMMLKNFRQYLT